MLHRREGEHVIAISQPAHAWVAGELARQWGNPEFGDFAPREEVVLAAALHDIGFLDWEQSPTFNPQTGLPHTFRDLPTENHLEIWTIGIRRMLDYGPYPALLVSQHFSWLCEKHRSASPADHELEAKFLEEQEAFQSALIKSLQRHKAFKQWAAEPVVLRNRRLITLWDWLSLLLCMGLREKQTVKDVPCLDGLTAIELRPIRENSPRIAVSPWPFRSESVCVACSGRELSKNYSSEAKMRRELQSARTVELRVDLVPG